MPDSDETKSLRERMEDIERLLADGGEEDQQLAEMAARIERFGVSAEQLAKALRMVEQSQRELILLKRRVSTAEEQKADKKTVTMQVSQVETQTKKDVRRVRSWAYSATIVALGLFGATVFAFSMYAKEKNDATASYANEVRKVCQQRDQQSQIMGRYLSSQLKEIENNPKYTDAQKAKAREQAAILKKAFPVIQCDKLVFR